jgi:hypothetical protein
MQMLRHHFRGARLAFLNRWVFSQSAPPPLPLEVSVIRYHGNVSFPMSDCAPSQLPPFTHNFIRTESVLVYIEASWLFAWAPDGLAIYPAILGEQRELLRT